jgi:hypothetical protein
VSVITIGRRVHYLLTAEQAAQINTWRAHATEPPAWSGLFFQEHVGSLVIEGDVVPLDVTRVLNVTAGQVNGRALLDGNDVLWVTGVFEGTEPGTWQWPPRKRE